MSFGMCVYGIPLELRSRQSGFGLASLAKLGQRCLKLLPLGSPARDRVSTQWSPDGIELSKGGPQGLLQVIKNPTPRIEWPMGAVCRSRGLLTRLVFSALRTIRTHSATAIPSLGPKQGLLRPSLNLDREVL